MDDGWIEAPPPNPDVHKAWVHQGRDLSVMFSVRKNHKEYGIEDHISIAGKNPPTQKDLEDAMALVGWTQKETKTIKPFRRPGYFGLHAYRKAR